MERTSDSLVTPLTDISCPLPWYFSHASRTSHIIEDENISMSTVSAAGECLSTLSAKMQL